MNVPALRFEVIKDVFSRHGTPDELYSDNGPQYTSTIFKTFTREWNFKSSGLAESSVTSYQEVFPRKPGHREGLLAIRNTPLQCGFSPVQLLIVTCQNYKTTPHHHRLKEIYNMKELNKKYITTTSTELSITQMSQNSIRDSESAYSTIQPRNGPLMESFDRKLLLDHT